MSAPVTPPSQSTALIGQPGSAARLPTPALVLDLDIFEDSLHAMQSHAARVGTALRPHAKTHKCAEIARRQLAAGAIGVCCAKLGEAEVLAAAGIDRILLTSPVVHPLAIERLVELRRGTAGLLAVVDDAENASALDRAMTRAGLDLPVLIDLDPGFHRTGIPVGDAAVSLARTIDRAASLSFQGLQMYAGHLMHIERFAERRERSLEVMRTLGAFRDRLLGDGLACEIVTGAGTGTFDIDPEACVLTDLQVGSYAFMDAEYLAIEGRTGAKLPFPPALFVQTTVVSSHHPGLATTDAGLKAFATDVGRPLPASRLPEGTLPEGTRYFFFGDEHGGVSWRTEGALPLGATLRAIPPHCDPTFNLYDWLHVIRSDRLVDVWRIDARGCGT